MTVQPHYFELSGETKSTVKPVLSGPHIMQTPSKLSGHQLSSYVYCKINLHSADTSVLKANVDTNIKNG